MMKVLVCDPVLGRFMDVLRDGYPDAEWVRQSPGDEAAILEHLADTDVFVGSRLTPEMAEAAPGLKLVHVSGAGTDKIADSVMSGSRGIPVANVFGHENSIAEHVLMVMLALSRHLLPTDSALRRGYWRNPAMHSDLPLHRTLRDETVGLVGYGHIGKRVEELVRPLGMEVLAIRSKAGPADGGSVLGGPEHLPELLTRSDHVVVVVPLTPATTAMILSAEFARMKPDAFLVNVSRGPVVDEEALYTALTTGQIAGCALDVWYQPGRRYPEVGLPADRPFWELANVILTPHVSGVTDDTFGTRAREIANNVNRFAHGLVPNNVVVRPARKEQP